MKDNKPGDKLMFRYFGPAPFRRNRIRILVSHFIKRRAVS